MSLEIDGFWKAGFWTTTFWADGFWFEGSRQTGGGGGGPLDMGEESPPFKPIIDITEPEDRFRGTREKNARVREQLRVALEGPQAQEVRAYVEPEPRDSTIPVHERIDVERFSDQQLKTIDRFYQAALDYKREAEKMRAAIARDREIDEDDDEVMMLL